MQAMSTHSHSYLSDMKTDTENIVLWYFTGIVMNVCLFEQNTELTVVSQ